MALSIYQRGPEPVDEQTRVPESSIVIFKTGEVPWLIGGFVNIWDIHHRADNEKLTLIFKPDYNNDPDRAWTIAQYFRFIQDTTLEPDSQFQVFIYEKRGDENRPRGVYHMVYNSHLTRNVRNIAALMTGQTFQDFSEQVEGSMTPDARSRLEEVKVDFVLVKFN